MVNSEEDPLIQINWSKIGRILKNTALSIIKIIRKIIEKILILIFRFLTLVVLAILWLYTETKQLIKWIIRKIHAFSKRNIKGFWFLVLLVIALILFGVFAYTQVKAQTALGKELQKQLKINQTQIDDYNKQIEENKKLKEQIKDLNGKLQAKAEEERRYAQQQYVIASRNKATQSLTPEVKGLIAKYAGVYQYPDTRLVECIVWNESGGRDEAVGDSGAARGVAQYHLATFLGHRRQMGLSQEDLRTDTESSIQAMLFSISRGGIGNWTARHKCM